MDPNTRKSQPTNLPQYDEQLLVTRNIPERTCGSSGSQDFVHKERHHQYPHQSRHNGGSFDRCSDETQPISGYVDEQSGEGRTVRGAHMRQDDISVAPSLDAIEYENAKREFASISGAYVDESALGDMDFMIDSNADYPTYGDQWRGQRSSLGNRKKRRLDRANVIAVEFDGLEQHIDKDLAEINVSQLQKYQDGGGSERDKTSSGTEQLQHLNKPARRPKYVSHRNITKHDWPETYRLLNRDGTFRADAQVGGDMFPKMSSDVFRLLRDNVDFISELYYKFRPLISVYYIDREAISYYVACQYLRTVTGQISRLMYCVKNGVPLLYLVYQFHTMDEEDEREAYDQRTRECGDRSVMNFPKDRIRSYAGDFMRFCVIMEVLNDAGRNYFSGQQCKNTDDKDVRAPAQYHSHTKTPSGEYRQSYSTVTSGAKHIGVNIEYKDMFASEKSAKFKESEKNRRDGMRALVKVVCCKFFWT